MARFCTQITFEGLNITRTLNKLSALHTLKNISRQGKLCSITVNSNVSKQVVAFLSERCYNIREVKKLGIAAVSDFFAKHFLVAVLFGLFVVALALSSRLCWKIEVVGDYPEQDVLQVLADCNIAQGKPLASVDVDILENTLATGLDAMYAVVSKNGSTLHVNVVAKKTVEAPVDMHVRRDIVATCGGKITFLLCEQGTAVAKVGDIVQKGDVLICGLRTFNDGTTQDVYALGKVVVRTQSSGFAEFSGTTQQTVETGRTFCTNAVVLFGKSYGKTVPFETYKVACTESHLSPLNLTVRHLTYFETVSVTQTATLDECLDVLKNKALSLAMQQADFPVKYTEYSVSQNGVTAVVYGETEIN